MSNEHVRFRPLSRGEDLVQDVVGGVTIKVEGSFWNRKAHIVDATNSEAGDEKPIPQGTENTTVAYDFLSRRQIARRLAREIGPGYDVGNTIRRGVFELVKDSRTRLVLGEGQNEDGNVVLVGSDGQEKGAMRTLPGWLGLRRARRQVESDGAGGYSFAKGAKGKK